jgi:hypothetical protein
MIALDLSLDGNGGWPDLEERDDVIYIEDGTLAIAVRRNGTTGGEPSIMLRIDLPSGHVVITQTSWRLLSTAVNAIAAQYGWMGGQWAPS